jgi:hypothetical protein
LIAATSIVSAARLREGPPRRPGVEKHESQQAHEAIYRHRTLIKVALRR